MIGCRSSLPGLADLTRLISAELDSDVTGLNRIRWLLHAANEVFRRSTDDHEKGKLLGQPSSVSEHLWAQRKWLALDGAVRSLDELAFWHADLKELPVENITAPALSERTADFGVIVPLPQELQLFSKPNLLRCLQSELHLGDDAHAFACGWLSEIAHVLWTEAEDVGDNQSALENIALQWRNARVVLDPNLSRRFTSDGVVIAEGIDVDAGWADEACLQNQNSVLGMNEHEVYYSKPERQETARRRASAWALASRRCLLLCGWASVVSCRKYSGNEDLRNRNFRW